jgi:hypothetical protein
VRGHRLWDIFKKSQHPTTRSDKKSQECVRDHRMPLEVGACFYHPVLGSGTVVAVDEKSVRVRVKGKNVVLRR